MDIAEKVLRAKTDLDDVYKAGEGGLWDIIQDYGNRIDYNSAFKCWGNLAYIRPKYKVVPTYSRGVCSIFEYNVYVKKIEAKYFDFSQKAPLDNNNGGYYYSFNGCTRLEEIEDIGFIPQHNYYSCFANCYKLHTIAKIGVDENTKYENTFTNCNALENITIEGTIGQKGFDIHWSTKLTHDSLMSIINALADKSGTGTTFTTTLGTENLAKLTDAEKAIATQKGWSFG